ncbi:hypothetical protein KDA_76500 [Dictyobacter alpinus]|uniref:Uncharacterized protein n=1 Tax=Dictyobacter alpinus TaxID=2014873 RepID=A0A402BLG2_9CHLR|nr:hypothetical protein [Dictyobacter alpinus]GCE32166.1 hypothetical protein KDA_76500 [Dictyobacter alpinus]
MHWKTANKHIGPNDCRVITQLYYAASLRIPVSRACIQLMGYRSENLGEIALPEPIIDDQAIEQMLQQAGLPLTGWAPGYEHMLSPYNNRKILYALLSMTRQIVEESGQTVVAIAELRNKFAVDDRLFTLHLLNLIQDAQGLVAVGEDAIRLASWHEAIEASAQLIRQGSRRTSGDVIQPKVQLRLSESYTGSEWVLTACSNGSFHLFQLEPPYTSLSGDAPAIDVWLKEQMFPLGWSATYGENETKRERALYKVNEMRVQ